MPCCQFSSKGRALWVWPSKTHHSIWKILFVLDADKYLERLEGRIRNSLSLCYKITVCTTNNKNVIIIWTSHRLCCLKKGYYEFWSLERLFIVIATSVDFSCLNPKIYSSFTELYRINWTSFKNNTFFWSVKGHLILLHCSDISQLNSVLQQHWYHRA